MFTQVEQNTVEQLEALVDQLEKREIFSALVGKMKQSPITDFFMACHQYYLAMDDYYKASAKDPDRHLYFEKAKMNIGVAQKIAANFLQKSPSSLAAQYMEIFLKARIPFDDERVVILRGGSDKWFSEAVTESKALAAHGFGPAAHFLVKAPTTSGEEITPMLTVAMKKGSVLCKAQLSQRYFADLLNNIDDFKKVHLPVGFSERDLILNLIVAIREGDYQSMSFLPNFLGDVCNALRALSQVYHDGNRKVSDNQVSALMQLAKIAKELSAVTGSREVSKKIDELIEQSNQAGISFKSAKDEIKSDQHKMAEFEKTVKEIEVRSLSEKLFKQKLTFNLVNVYKVKFDNDDPDILILFKDHPKFRQKENVSPNTKKVLLKKTVVKAQLSEKEIMDYLLLKVQEALKNPEYTMMAEGGSREFIELATQRVKEQGVDFSSAIAVLVDKAADHRCTEVNAALKRMNEEVRSYIHTRFAGSISKALADPRVIKPDVASWARVGPSQKTDKAVLDSSRRPVNPSKNAVPESSKPDVGPSEKSVEPVSPSSIKKRG